MRIAILGQYPLDTKRLGGVEVAIVYLQRELLASAEDDVTLHIVTCRTDLVEPKTVEEGRLTVTYLPRGGLGRATWHLQEAAALRRVVREFEPDIVHAHGSGLYAGAALSCGYPAVVTVHGIASQEARLAEGFSNRMRGLLDSAYERWVVGRTKHLILITPYVERVFEGIFNGRSYLVENACEDRFFDVSRHAEPGRLFFAGPVIPRKGVLPLLKALKRVREQAPEAHLRIAGSLAADPIYAAACQTYAADEGLDDAAEFLGHIPQEQVLEEYSRCVAFVLPSFQETAPMVIEQAMAAGVPSVATRAGGVPWMLDDGVTGLTLPVPVTLQGDAGPLADALLRLLTARDEARTMGERAKAEAERRFRPREVARRTMQVYQQVVATP